MVRDQAYVHGGVAPVHHFWASGAVPGEESRPGATRRSDGAERSSVHDTTLLLLGASKLVFFWILSCSVTI